MSCPCRKSGILMKNIIYLFIVMLLMDIYPQYANAQNKAVIIPLNTNKQSSADKSIYGGGKIGSGGTILYRFGGDFSVEHFGDGLYWIVLPGVRPNCEGPSIMGLSSLDLFGFIKTPGILYSCVTGDVKMLVETADIAGNHKDMIFNILIIQADYMLDDQTVHEAFNNTTKNIKKPNWCEYSTKTETMTCW